METSKGKNGKSPGNSIKSTKLQQNLKQPGLYAPAYHKTRPYKASMPPLNPSEITESQNRKLKTQANELALLRKMNQALQLQVSDLNHQLEESSNDRDVSKILQDVSDLFENKDKTLIEELKKQVALLEARQIDYSLIFEDLASPMPKTHYKRRQAKRYAPDELNYDSDQSLSTAQRELNFGTSVTNYDSDASSMDTNELSPTLTSAAGRLDINTPPTTPLTDITGNRRPRHFR